MSVHKIVDTIYRQIPLSILKTLHYGWLISNQTLLDIDVNINSYRRV